MLRIVVVLFLAGISVGGTCHLAGDYWQANFGVPDAQWQFGFMISPLIIGLGAASALLARYPHPQLARGFVYVAWGLTAFPAVLTLLVLAHAYRT